MQKSESPTAAEVFYMHVRTLLNQFLDHPGFVFENEHLVENDELKALVFEVRPRKHSKPICPHCGEKCSSYDRLSPRLFEFVPFWGLHVYFRYAMRRVDCESCGVKVEKVPWADGKSPVTHMLAWFVEHWAHFLSWTEVGRQFGLSWQRVYQCVEKAVHWGRDHMNMAGITSIGIDEIARARGHRYVTLVYQIDSGSRRLLHISEGRSEQSLKHFFNWLGPDRAAAIRFVCSDMWKPYLKVIREFIPGALQVLDRFHIMQHFNKAIDQVRAEEARKLAHSDRNHVLKKARWTLLKRKENLSESQGVKLSELLKANLRSVKAYLLREQFQMFWQYKSPGWARKFLRQWTFIAMRSQIEPVKRVARMLRNHEELIINWFRAKGQISNGVVEGLNGKGRVITKRAYGFRTEKALEIALYHELGDLPVPKFTHRFW